MKGKNGDGSVFLTKNGKYACIIQIDTYNDNGNKKRVKRIADTPEEARRRAQKAVKSILKEEAKESSLITEKSTFGYCIYCQPYKYIYQLPYIT